MLDIANLSELYAKRFDLNQTRIGHLVELADSAGNGPLEQGFIVIGIVEDSFRPETSIYMRSVRDRSIGTVAGSEIASGHAWQPFARCCP